MLFLASSAKPVFVGEPQFDMKSSVFYQFVNNKHVFILFLMLIFAVSNSSSLTEAAALERNHSLELVMDGTICDRDTFDEAYKETGAVCQYSHHGPNPLDPLFGALS